MSAFLVIKPVITQAVCPLVFSSLSVSSPICIDRIHAYISIFSPFQEDFLLGNEPIQEGSEITKSHLLALMVGFTLRHRLSAVAICDLLELFNLLIPGCLPTSKYYIDKLFFMSRGSAQVHYVCPNCDCYTGIALPVVCGKCQEVISDTECYSQGSFFLVMPLEYQLKELVKSTQDLLRTEARGGTMYDEKLNDFLSDPCNLTLSISTDGAPVFRSSRRSIWPLFCSVNELPYDIRKENVLLHSLWFGKKKPPVLTLFRPFLAEMDSLHGNGFEWFDNNGLSHLAKVAVILCI